MFKKINSKKAVVIETVIVAIIITFALSMLMVIYSLKSEGMVEFSKNRIEERVIVDQIVDDYIRSVNNHTYFDKYQYTYEFNGHDNYYNIKITNKDNEKEIRIEDVAGLLVYAHLYLNVEDNKFYVSKWNYGE